MTIFKPFRGCRYNPSVVTDPASALCPPYDMIGPELEQKLKELNPYNAVHLEGGEQPNPVDPEAGYRQAAALFRQWLEEGVLRRDPEPSFYLMRHGYQFRGEHKEQLGLFGGVRVEDYDSRVVLPHENTREPAVLDRVALLDFCQAQFSPIMTTYRDGEGALRPVFEQVMNSAAPALEVTDSPDGDVSLWRITDRAVQERISAFFTQRPVFLADGHHRYEAALRYRKERQAGGGSDPNAAYNYAMMALVEFNDPGLLLLPYHRTLGGLSPEQLDRLRDQMDEVFEVHPVDLAAEGGVERLLERVDFLGSDRHALAVVGPAPNEAYLLLLRPGINWREWGDLAVSEGWVMEEKVLRPVLGDALGRHLDYSHDHDQAVARVGSGRQQLAILLKPFPLDAFESIVGDGHRLPAKSTFFYPKLPTGLVISQLEGTL